MNGLAVRENGSALPQQASGLTLAQVELIKTTICKEASHDELALFLQICNRTGLDPFAKQIYSISRWDAKAQRSVHQTQISIDGMRIVAQRSGKYRGQTQTQWCGDNGVWKDVWLQDSPPAAARVGVYHADFVEPLYAVATMRSYGQRTKEGGLTTMWRNLSDVMLAKCAEGLALRKAFPNDLSGLYTGEEMAQASNNAPADGSVVKKKLTDPSETEHFTDYYNYVVAEIKIAREALGYTGEDVKRVCAALTPPLSTSKAALAKWTIADLERCKVALADDAANPVPVIAVEAQVIETVVGDKEF